MRGLEPSNILRSKLGSPKSKWWAGMTGAGQSNKK